LRIVRRQSVDFADIQTQLTR